MIDSQVWTALLLTGIGAAGTALGGLLVVAQPKLDFKRLGYLQGLAAGLMLCISLFDLYPEAEEAVGFASANLWFYAGVAFFAVVVAYIPEPPAGMVKIEDDDTPTAASEADTRQASGKTGRQGLADTATGAPGSPTSSRMMTRSKAKASPPTSPVVSGSEGEAERPRRGRRSAAASASGQAASYTSPTATTLAAAEGAPAAAAGGSVDSKVAAAGTNASGGAGAGDAASKREAKKRVLMSGLITAVGIALHNFPEGVAVFLASMKSTAVGAWLAFAIALHNIPEGVAVSLPVYFATGSRMRGFMYAFLSGLAEPAAVVVLALAYPKGGLDKQLIDKLLAAVGGIMAFLALHELLPLSMEHAGQNRAVLCVFAGMALMSANLYLLHGWLGVE